MPDREDLVDGDISPELISGGETVALERLRVWAADSLVEYEDRHNDLPGDATSRISADLHFGCSVPARGGDATPRAARRGAVRPPALLA